jgi:cytochrome c oxidase cbb3-type subunit IV
MSPEMQAFAGVVRGVMAGALLVIFVGLWVWVYGARRRQWFESAARLPLEEDGPGGRVE